MSETRTVQDDPVLALLSEGRGDPRSLYYLWEGEQWEAGQVDLTLDAEGWDGVVPETRRAVADSIAWRRLRAEMATVSLVAFVDVAPSEEQQVFLTTQLVDEARHLVFFDRVMAEVARAAGETMEERAGVVDDPSIRDLLARELADAGQRLRELPGSGRAALVGAVCGFHLGIVGAVGLTQLHALVEYLEAEDTLPGIRRGLTLEARAARRHVAFGLGLIAREIAEDPALTAVVQASMDRWLPVVRSALTSESSVAPAVYGPAGGLSESATMSLGRWFAGVDLEVTVPG